MRIITIEHVEDELEHLIRHHKSFAVVDVFQTLHQRYSHLEYREVERIVHRSLEKGVLSTARYCTTTIDVALANGNIIERTVYFDMEEGDIDGYAEKFQVKKEIVSTKPSRRRTQSIVSAEPTEPIKPVKRRRKRGKGSGAARNGSGQLVISARILDQLDLNGTVKIPVLAKQGSIEVHRSQNEFQFKYTRSSDGRIAVGVKPTLEAFGLPVDGEEFHVEVQHDKIVITLSKEQSYACRCKKIQDIKGS